jgi:hypothetical protein
MYRSTFSRPRHLLELSDQLHDPAALPPGKCPSRYALDMRGQVEPRADLDDMEKRIFLTIPGLELGPLGRPVAIPTALSRF